MEKETKEENPKERKARKSPIRGSTREVLMGGGKKIRVWVALRRHQTVVRGYT